MSDKVRAMQQIQSQRQELSDYAGVRLDIAAKKLNCDLAWDKTNVYSPTKRYMLALISFTV